MAVTLTNVVAHEDNADLSAYSTGSWTPVAGRHYLATVASRHATAAVIPTLAGNGMTWNQVATSERASNGTRVTVFEAVGVATAGALTATFSEAQGGAFIAVDESPVGLTVVQSAVANGANASTRVVTLATFGDANNVTFGAFTLGDNASPAVGAGYTSLTPSTLFHGALGQNLLTEWIAANDTSVDDVTPTPAPWAGVALELAESGGGGGGSGGRLLLETSATDGYLLEDGSGVLVTEDYVPNILRTADDTTSVTDDVSRLAGLKRSPPDNVGVAYDAVVRNSTPQNYWRLGQAGDPLTDEMGGPSIVSGGLLTYGVTGLIVSGDAGLEFAGTSGADTDGDVPSLGSDWSIELWFKVDVLDAVRTLIRHGDGQVKLIVDTTATGLALAWDDFDANSHTMHSSQAIATGQVYHVVGRYDSTTELMTLWLNGRQVGSQTSVVDPIFQTFWYLGTAGGLQYFDGVIDDVALYARLLTDVEIASHYEVGAARLLRTLALARPTADTTSVTDDVARAIGIVQAIADTTSATDNVERLLASVRAIDDAASASDDVARLLASSSVIADTTSVSDALERTLAATRQATDTTTVSEDIAHTTSANLTRTATDTTELSEEPSRVLNAARAPPDTVATSETLSRALGATRAPTDTITVVSDLYNDTFDTVCPIGSQSGSWTYSASAGGRCDASAGSNDNVSNTLGVVVATKSYRFIGHYATRVGGASRDLSVRWVNSGGGTVSDVLLIASGTDTAGVSFDTTKVAPATATGFRMLSTSNAALSSLQVVDLAALQDAVVRLLAAIRALTDTVTTSESITYSVGWVRTAIDTTSMSESPERLVNAIRGPPDTVTTSDSVFHEVTPGSVAYDRTAADTTTVTDDVARVFGAIRAAADTTSASDAAERVIGAVRLATDSTELSESVSHALAFGQALTDTTSLSEDVARTVTAFRTAADSLTTDDSVAAVSSHTRSLEDTTSVTDAVAGVSTHERTAADAVVTDDSIAHAAPKTRTAADTISTTDDVARSGVFIRAVIDTTSVTDSIDSGDGNQTRQATDSVPIGADAVDRLLELHVVAVDSIETSDEAASARATSRTAEDSTAVSDSVASSQAGTSQVSDTVSTTDVIATVKTLGREAEDSTDVDDDVAGRKALFRAAADSVVTDDEVQTFGGVYAAVVDTVATDDQLGRTLAVSRLVSDAVVTTDSLAHTKSGGAELTRSAGDTVVVSDAVGRQLATSRQVVDTVPVPSDLIATEHPGASSTLEADVISSTISADAVSSSMAADTVVSTLEIEEALSSLEAPAITSELSV